jgi:hypothetical protein
VNGCGADRHTAALDAPRRTTEELPAVDVRKLEITPAQERVEDIAPLQWTPCNFGGSRPWFVCPGEGCARRVAILYGTETGQMFCRHCRDLRYASQRENRIAKAKRRMIKARERLPEDRRKKPKRMRQATFDKLLREHIEAKREYDVLRWRKYLARVLPQQG